MSKLFSAALAVFVVTGAVPAALADSLTKADVAKLGKAATVFVQVKTPAGTASGSGFCVHPSGVFVTNEHVIHDATEISVVLNASLKDQQLLKAKVLRSDPQLDLALLQVEGQKDLPALTLGTVDKLIELQDVIAFGFPFGKNLATDKDAYPAMTIGTGSISSLRQKDGALHRIQLDVELNPGNSGGPLLDLDGKVVGIVVSGIRTARINFAIPVSHLAGFARRPEIRFTPPTGQAADAPVVYQVRLIDALPPAKPYEVELIVATGGVERRHKMALADGVYAAKSAPAAKPDGALPLRLAIKFADGLLEAPTADLAFKVGGREVRLAEVRSLTFGEKAGVVLHDGKTLDGAVAGLEAVAVRLGGQKLAVDLTKAERVTVSGPAAGMSFVIVVRADGKEIARLPRAAGGGVDAKDWSVMCMEGGAWKERPLDKMKQTVTDGVLEVTNDLSGSGWAGVATKQVFEGDFAITAEVRNVTKAAGTSFGRWRRGVGVGRCTGGRGMAQGRPHPQEWGGLDRHRRQGSLGQLRQQGRPGEGGVFPSPERRRHRRDPAF